MARFFLQVGYKGTRYSGSQVQENALTVQWELEKALRIYFRGDVPLTGSSRTDAGVHALENYYHFDLDLTQLPHSHAWKQEGGLRRSIYNLNAILPPDIVVNGIFQVAPDAHSRFHALSREYNYFVYRSKDPFMDDRGYYFPYALDAGKMQEAADLVKGHSDFSSFAKRGAQHRTPLCRIEESTWEMQGNAWRYTVRANRFLRGMVRGLVGTMLQVGRGKLSLADLEGVFQARDPRFADFTAPGHGLFLVRVVYPEGLLVADGSINASAGADSTLNDLPIPPNS